MTSLPNNSSRPSLSGIESVFQPETDVFNQSNANEDVLSEAELREIYDREEIDRFLNLFSTVRRPCRFNLYDLKLATSSSQRFKLQERRRPSTKMVDPNWLSRLISKAINPNQ